MSITGESSFTGSWYPFDDAEKKLIRRSWRTLETNTEQVSCGIYTMIFNQCPEARKLFPFMRLPANESDKKSKEFVFQALRFIQVLESAVLNLDNLDAFNPILDNLGRRHGKLESSVGFRPCYWSVFLECTIFHIRLALANSRIDNWGEAELDSVVVLWRHLVDGICERIKAGYLVDVANRSNSKSVCSSTVLSVKSSPYYVDIPPSHEVITEPKQPITSRSEPAYTNVRNDLEVDTYSTGCFSRICWPICRNKVKNRVVTKCYY